MRCTTSLRAAIAAISFVALTSPANAASPSLIDQTGKHFSFDQLRGTPLIVTFIAARCTDACPLIDAQISTAAHDTRARAGDVRFLTLTLDPEHDTPAVMRHLARTFDAQTPRWTMATGTPAVIHDLMRRFDVVAQNDKNGIPEMHTTFVYILDGNGRLQHAVLASANLPSDIFAAVPAR